MPSYGLSNSLKKTDCSRLSLLKPADDGKVKLAAGWLIEKAGIAKGTRRGAFGVSTRHALALVHIGGGTTADLLIFADEICARVRDRFGIGLEREPRLLR